MSKPQLKAGRLRRTSVSQRSPTRSIKARSARRPGDKFGIEDFKTDVVNAFTDIAQQVDLTAFTQALTDAEAAIFGLTGSQSGVKNTFRKRSWMARHTRSKNDTVRSELGDRYSARTIGHYWHGRPR